MPKPETTVLSKTEYLEALEEVRRSARILLDGMRKNSAEDAYTFKGAMNDVEDLLEDVEAIEHMEMTQTTYTPPKTIYLLDMDGGKMGAEIVWCDTAEPDSIDRDVWEYRLVKKVKND